MMRKLIRSLILGIMTYAILASLAYFPRPWIASFAMVIAALCFYSVDHAILLTLALFGIAVLYHSAVAFVVYAALCIILIAMTAGFPAFPEIFFITVGAPLLAFFHPFSHTLPLEFLAVFLAPVLIQGREMPSIAAAACVCCVLVGMLGHHDMVGNLVIGSFSGSPSLSGGGPTNFYDLSWAMERFGKLAWGDLTAFGFKLGKFILSHPLVLLQVAAWTLASFMLGFFREKPFWWLRLAGAFLTAGMLFFLQILVLHFYPEKVALDFLRLAFTLGGSVVVLFGLEEWAGFLAERA